MFTYLFGRFLRRVFSLLWVDGILYIYNALAWRHRFFFLSKILSAFFTWSLGIRSCIHSWRPHLQNSSSPGVWHETPFTATSVPKTDFLYPYFCWRNEGATSVLGFWPIVSLLSSSLSGDCFGLLYVQYIPSLSIRSQSANICWFPFWSGFVTSGLTYITIPLLTVIFWRPANSNTEG